MIKQLVLIATIAFVTSSALAENIPTRFGMLEIREDNVLLYENRPLNPQIQGSNRLRTVGTYQIGNSDIVLIENIGGTACPSQFHFVIVSASGVKATSPFGTCNDNINVNQVGDSILVTMTGYMGLMGLNESRADQRKALNKKHVYVFKGETITENGKLVK
jgi:hypothetical protein